MNEPSLPSILFFLFAGLACAGAVGVLVFQRIVYMAGALLVSLAAAAGLFFIAGADFVGLVQLMVYVGGTVVLLAFGVMLTARRNQPAWQVPGVQWAVGLAVGGCLLVVLLWTVLAVPQWQTASAPEAAEGAPSAPGVLVRSGSRQTSPSQTGTIGPLGWAMLGVRTEQADQSDALPDVRQTGQCGYLLPFEIISVHLVLVLVGAAFLARAKRPPEPRPLEQGAKVG
ncbi:MAG TPA: NADH-quinone oxidoreductase subunit J [Thermoguttaceae bacterium]|nr:NADH-quinone oxidoreductase subunit J [Thermoguttaceae bacterium]